MRLLVLLIFRHPVDTDNLIWRGGIVSDFTPSTDVCLRLTDTDKDTIARVGLPARLLVFWCVFSLTLSLCSYRSKWFSFSLAIQKVYFASSHLISPTNYEPRILPIYISVGDVPTLLSRRCCVIYHSLENDVTLISSGYMSTSSCYQHEILVWSVRPIITDWTSPSNSRMHTNITRSLFCICGPS